MYPQGSREKVQGLFHFQEQKQIAEDTLSKCQSVIDAEFGNNLKPITTKLTDGNLPENVFYYAEDYHQQYDAKPSGRDYCGLRPLKFSSDVMGKL